MRRIDDYPEPTLLGLPVHTQPGQTIGQIIRYALESGVSPDAPLAEISDDSDLDDDDFTVDPYGDIRTDWFEEKELQVIRELAAKAPPVVIPNSEPEPPLNPQNHEPEGS